MSTTLDVAVLRLPGNDDLPIPERATEGAAGFDLCAAVRSELTIPAGGRMRVPCGFSLAIPLGFEGQVRPRSGIAFKHGVTVLNAPGTIDSDYRGELTVLLINLGSEAFSVVRGLRIAQIVFAPVCAVEFRKVDVLPSSPRGSGGFGHTGL
jgi:dUTP pyrophosphatase